VRKIPFVKLLSPQQSTEKTSLSVPIVDKKSPNYNPFPLLSLKGICYAGLSTARRAAEVILPTKLGQFLPDQKLLTILSTVVTYALRAYFIIEVLFLFYLTHRTAVMNRRPVPPDLPPTSSMRRAHLRRIFANIAESGQCPILFIRKWFHGALLTNDESSAGQDAKIIRLVNIREWIAGSFFCKTLDELSLIELKEIDDTVSYVSRLTGITPLPGYSPEVKCIRFNLDPMRTLHRPAITYAVTITMKEVFGAYLLRSLGFELHESIFNTYWYRPATNAKANQKAQIYRTMHTVVIDGKMRYDGYEDHSEDDRNENAQDGGSKLRKLSEGKDGKNGQSFSNIDNTCVECQNCTICSPNNTNQRGVQSSSLSVHELSLSTTPFNKEKNKKTQNYPFPQNSSQNINTSSQNNLSPTFQNHFSQNTNNISTPNPNTVMAQTSTREERIDLLRAIHQPSTTQSKYPQISQKECQICGNSFCECSNRLRYKQGLKSVVKNGKQGQNHKNSQTPFRDDSGLLSPTASFQINNNASGNVFHQDGKIPIEQLNNQLNNQPNNQQTPPFLPNSNSVSHGTYSTALPPNTSSNTVAVSTTSLHYDRRGSRAHSNMSRGAGELEIDDLMSECDDSDTIVHDIRRLGPYGYEHKVRKWAKKTPSVGKSNSSFGNLSNSNQEKTNLGKKAGGGKKTHKAAKKNVQLTSDELYIQKLTSFDDDYSTDESDYSTANDSSTSSYEDDENDINDGGEDEKEVFNFFQWQDDEYKTDDKIGENKNEKQIPNNTSLSSQHCCHCSHHRLNHTPTSTSRSPPQQKRPRKTFAEQVNRAENEDGAIVFCHGIGVGVWSYYLFLKEMIDRYPHRDIFLPNFDYISMQLYEYVPSARQVVSSMRSMLLSKGFLNAVFMSHSYGTMVASHVARFEPSLISHLILIDPVCLLLHLMDGPFMFLFKEPTTFQERMINYLAQTEVHIVASMQRHLWWFETLLFDCFLPSGSTVVLSGKDSIAPSSYIRSYLQTSSHRVRLLWLDNLAHAGFIGNYPAIHQILDCIAPFQISKKNKKRKIIQHPISRCAAPCPASNLCPTSGVYVPATQLKEFQRDCKQKEVCNCGADGGIKKNNGKNNQNEVDNDGNNTVTLTTTIKSDSEQYKIKTKRANNNNPFNRGGNFSINSDDSQIDIQDLIHYHNTHTAHPATPNVSFDTSTSSTITQASTISANKSNNLSFTPLNDVQSRQTIVNKPLLSPLIEKTSSSTLSPPFAHTKGEKLEQQENKDSSDEYSPQNGQTSTQIVQNTNKKDNNHGSNNNHNHNNHNNGDDTHTLTTTGTMHKSIIFNSEPNSDSLVFIEIDRHSSDDSGGSNCNGENGTQGVRLSGNNDDKNPKNTQDQPTIHSNDDATHKSNQDTMLELSTTSLMDDKCVKTQQQQQQQHGLYKSKQHPSFSKSQPITPTNKGSSTSLNTNLNVDDSGIGGDGAKKEIEKGEIGNGEKQVDPVTPEQQKSHRKDAKQADSHQKCPQHKPTCPMYNKKNENNNDNNNKKVVFIRNCGFLLDDEGNITIHPTNNIPISTNLPLQSIVTKHIESNMAPVDPAISIYHDQHGNRPMKKESGNDNVSWWGKIIGTQDGGESNDIKSKIGECGSSSLMKKNKIDKWIVPADGVFPSHSRHVRNTVTECPITCVSCCCTQDYFSAYTTEIVFVPNEP
jgi:pimeloyl-ACP methyl ester carboxylesterase